MIQRTAFPRLLRAGCALGTLAVLGCAGTTSAATGILERDLQHDDPRVRVASARRAADEGRRDLAGLLVANLGDRDEPVRFFTAIALKRLTGEDHGYRSYAGLADREAAVARWRRWLEASGAAAPEDSGARERP